MAEKKTTTRAKKTTEVKAAVKAVGDSVKAAPKKIADKLTADKIEVKKNARKVSAAVKDAAGKIEKGVKKPVNKAKAAKLEIIIQSPMGGNITPEEIAAKLPARAKTVFVRIDQNKLWWINGEETGSVDIWE